MKINDILPTLQSIYIYETCIFTLDVSLKSNNYSTYEISRNNYINILSTALMRKLHHLSLNFVKHIWQVLELICYAFQLNLFAALQRKQKCWYVVRTSSNFVRIYLFYYNLAFILFGNSQHIKAKNNYAGKRMLALSSTPLLTIYLN